MFHIICQINTHNTQQIAYTLLYTRIPPHTPHIQKPTTPLRTEYNVLFEITGIYRLYFNHAPSSEPIPSSLLMFTPQNLRQSMCATTCTNYADVNLSPLDLRHFIDLVRGARTHTMSTSMDSSTTPSPPFGLSRCNNCKSTLHHQNSLIRDISS